MSFSKPRQYLWVNKENYHLLAMGQVRIHHSKPLFLNAILKEFLSFSAYLILSNLKYQWTSIEFGSIRMASNRLWMKNILLTSKRQINMTYKLLIKKFRKSILIRNITFNRIRISFWCLTCDFEAFRLTSQHTKIPYFIKRIKIKQRI